MDDPSGGKPNKEIRPMAETIEKPKKTKAPAKPKAATGTEKKAPANKQTSTAKSVPKAPTHQEIARLAEKYWAERGHSDGHAEQDWLRAERELLKQAS
jgi:hypothetical protein